MHEESVSMEKYKSKARVAVLGYGNVGKGVIDSLNDSKDMELGGVVTNRSEEVKRDIKYAQVVDDLAKLSNIDIAIICYQSELVRDKSERLVSAFGINTVDSFDIHSQIFDYKKQLDESCRKYNTTSIISAGWDPGIDSVIRILFDYSIPNTETETKFGPGMSMGHSTAVRRMSGVLDAVSITIPTEKNGIHERQVYVAIESGVDPKQIEESILTSHYFISDDTHVNFEPSDRVRQRRNDMKHGGHIYRANKESGQELQYHVIMSSNPQFTGHLMVAAARATLRMPSGAYTMIEVPPIYFSEKPDEELLRHLV